MNSGLPHRSGAFRVVFSCGRRQYDHRWLKVTGAVAVLDAIRTMPQIGAGWCTEGNR
jgi:hypothetical protein